MAPTVLFSLVLLHQIYTSDSEENLESRRTSLAQLPLEKLLHVKHALSAKDMFEKGDSDPVEADGEGPLPLKSADWDKRRRKKPARRGDHWDDEKEGKEKGEISSIFQSTVTVLSFLAFGGYLLCLIVQAVRNGAAGTNPTIMTTVMPVVGRKRKKRSAEDAMLHTLHRLAEAYSVYSLANEETHKKR